MSEDFMPKLYPYQEQFLKAMKKSMHMANHLCLTPLEQFSPKHAAPTYCDVFDLMTSRGWKLDLISGIYYK